MPPRADLSLAVETVVVMAKRKSMSRRRPKPVLLPAQTEIDAQRRKLPNFDPYDTRQLLADAAPLESRGINRDAALTVVWRENKKNQIDHLLRCLGYDPSNPDWQKAFSKLARLYFNVGRLAYRQPAGRANASTWTPAAELNLIMEVRRLVRGGFTEKEAIKIIGEDPAYDAIFPYREQMPGRREIKRQMPVDEWHEGTRTERIADLRKPRADALLKYWRRLKETFQGTPDPLARALGAIPPESDFEQFLWLLNPPPNLPADRKRQSTRSLKSQHQ
jgi:hypothetical protein